MLICRRALLAGAASLGASARALAEDTPLDLQSGKRVKPKQDRPTDAPKLSDAEIIAKANDFLNTTRFMSADFVQIGPDGRRSEGLLVLLRPGRMLFRYKPPQKIEVVADGRSLAVRDQKLATQDLYLIGQTPLKFLLSDHIDLAHDTTVKRVELDGHAAMIEIEDKATFGGKSDVTLVFDPDTFELKQWTVIDPQGFHTQVSLSGLDLVTKPDPAWFYIDDRVQSNNQPNIHQAR
jgi:outer membrane lipoprotein-sorting protein